MKRLPRIAPAVPCSVLLFSLAGAAPVARAAATAEQAELAERLLQTGQQLAPIPAARAVAKAVADVAEHLFENDPRLLRTAIDLRLAVGDRDRALELLNAYRRFDPADQIAQVQSIDLQQSKLESATERADYLSRVAASERVSSEVRSHAAVLLATVEIERGNDAAVAAAVDQALGLNPLNPKALRMRADAAAASGSAAQRTAAWVGLLRADPLQFATASRLGEELLRAGLTQAAGEFYKKFFEAIAAAGYGPGTEDSINAACLLASAGRDRDAADIAAAALHDDPADLRLHGMRMLLTQNAKDDAGFKQSLTDARTQALRNLMGLHTVLDPSGPRLDDATVVTLPDVKADAAAVKGGSNAKLADDYLHGLEDLAWVDVYFGGRAPDAAVTDAINTLAGPDSALSHRIAGFAALAAGRPDEADVAFAPVAADDALSRLGLLALRLKKGQDKAAVLTDAGKLLEEMPTDVWPLVIRQTVKEAGVPTFRAAASDAVAAEAAKLPADWSAFPAQGRSVYLVDVDPQGGGVEIGQPVLVRVTLQNTSNHALAIGPGGAVAQQVSLDATVRGAAEQGFQSVAIAKLTGRLVLPPGQSVTTLVRLDSPEFGAFLASSPQVGASVFVSAVTNPVTRQNGIGPGPGGFRTQARGVIDRPQVAYRRPEVRDALAKQMASPDAVRRLRAVSALAASARWLAGLPSDDAKPLAGQAVALLQKAAGSDASSTVRAIARQELFSITPDANRGAAVMAMLGSPDFESRVLATLMLINAPKATRETALKDLLTADDATIASLAKAVAGLPDAPPPAAATAPAGE